MKTVSKLVLLFAALVVVGCGGGGGGGGTTPNPTPTPAPTPTPTPIPSPVYPKVSYVCSLGAFIPRTTQYFARVSDCTVSSKKPIPIKGLTITAHGPLVSQIGSVAASEVVSDGKGGEVWNGLGITKMDVTTGQAKIVFDNDLLLTSNKIVIEATFAESSPLTPGEKSRGVTFTLDGPDAIVMGEKVDITATFPLKIGMAQIEKGFVFGSYGSTAHPDAQIIRGNLEDGGQMPLTEAVPVAWYNITANSVGSRIAFLGSGDTLTVMDTDGAGCLPTPGPGCNKGYTGISLGGIAPSYGKLGVTPSADILAFGGYQGVLFQSDIFIVRADGTNLFQVTNDEYLDSDPIISNDQKEVLFVSCRPYDAPMTPYDPAVPCVNWSVFKRGIDLTSNTTVGDIQGVFHNDTWVFKMSGFFAGWALSADGKKLVVSYHPEDAPIGIIPLAVMNVDGTGFKVIGNGFSPSWSSDGRILYTGDVIPVDKGDYGQSTIISDADGENQGRVIGFPPEGFLLIPGV